MITYNEKLPWQEFARITIQTNDLDPVYEALRKANLPMDTKLRWTTAFFTFYHMGTACEVCTLTGDDFWSALYNKSSTAPRAAERRHFRGNKALDTIVQWRNTFGDPENFAKACMLDSFTKVLNAGIPQIGTYFSWKACDFRESVFGAEVDWTKAENNLIKLPKQGLDMIFPGESPDKSLMKVLREVEQYDSPNVPGSKCNIAVAETIACMIKGYYGKSRKPIGSDIVEKREHLKGFGPVADELLNNIPKEPFHA